ncbi:MAG: tRNA lysidine(34) synthetase TilS [Alteromonadaceae bacterium]|nr:MAG: tRNA lysidine(34) synthetase TilS [Alteromonadaceae bacterium]
MYTQLNTVKTMTDLLASLQEFLNRVQPQAPIWLAYSGGQDSSVLLHLLSRINPPLPLKIVHVNHQLSNNAEAWQQHCITTAKTLGYRCQVESAQVNRQGKGLEGAAREARYRIFERLIEPGEYLFTAHHQNDQAETMLFRCLRGSGLRGMRAMEQQRSLAQGTLARPLLNISQADISAYAEHFDLKWIEDESNDDLRFDRNFLRHTIFPSLNERWPGSVKRMARTSTWLGEANSLLEEYLDTDLHHCNQRLERLGQSIAIPNMNGFSEARVKHLIQFWVNQQGYAQPSHHHIKQLKNLLEAKADANPLVAWGDCELRRYQNRLYILPRPPHIPTPQIQSKTTWLSASPLTLKDGSILKISADSLDTSHDSGSTYPKLTVSYRAGGERCKPTTRAKSQTLKKLLQEYAVEPWLRDRIPLIFQDGQLIAVGDIFSCTTTTSNNQPNLSFDWSYLRSAQTI